jgi:hypothetical protein
MTSCIYCHKHVWPWQPHVFSFHSACLGIYCQGYAQGIKIASEQAAKLLAEMQKKFAQEERPHTLQ